MKNNGSIVMILTLPWVGVTHAQLSASEARALFDQANASFRAANMASSDTERTEGYQQTILLYERLMREGKIQNAKLYYNLGNAYLLSNDLGRAILNYRRAERLDRSDPDIQKNLSFARSRRLDRVGIKTEQRVRQTLFFWHYDFTLQTRMGVACLGFGILCMTICLMIWRGRNSLSTVTIVLSVLLFAACAGSVLVEVNTQADKAYGVITVEQTLAYQGDAETYPKSFKDPLHAGTEFEVLEQRPGWLHIRLADDSQGWIADPTAEII